MAEQQRQSVIRVRQRKFQAQRPGGLNGLQVREQRQLSAAS